MVTKEQIETVNLICADLKKASVILNNKPECLTGMVYHALTKIKGFEKWVLHREHLPDGSSILKLFPFSIVVGSYEFYNGIPRICGGDVSIDPDSSHSFRKEFPNGDWKKPYEESIALVENYVKRNYGMDTARDGVDRLVFAVISKTVKGYLSKGKVNQERCMMPIMASLLNFLYKGEKTFAHHGVNIAGHTKFCLGFYNTADRLVLLDQFLNRVTEYDSCGGYEDPSWMVYGELHHKKYELGDDLKLIEEVKEEFRATIAAMKPIEVAAFIKSYISIIGSSNDKVNLWLTKMILSNMGIVSQFCIPELASEITTLTLMVGINGDYLNEYGITSNDLDSLHTYKPITDDYLLGILSVGRLRMIPDISLIEKCTAEIVNYYVRKKVD